MKKMTEFFDEKIFPSMLYISGSFIIFAFITQVTMAVMTAVVPGERMLDISNKMTWKFDGNFKNHPDNIFYEGEIK
jgi:hypothetical protein